VEEMRNVYKIMVGKSEGEKRLLKRPWCRWNDNIRINLHIWEDNIRRNLSEIGWEGVVWIRLAQDRNQWQALVNTVANFKVSQKVGNFLTS
jgi:hypothetical protein